MDATDAAAAPPPSVVPARQRRHPILPIERVGAFIEVLLCSGFPTQLLIFGGLRRLRDAAPDRRTAAGRRRSCSRCRSSTWCSWSAWSCCSSARITNRLRTFVRGPRRPLREIALGLVLIPGAVVVVVARADRRSWPSSRSCTTCRSIRSSDMLQTPRDAVIFAFVVMIAGGVREEIQRGFIIRRFDQYLGGGLAGHRHLQRRLRPRPHRAGIRGRDRDRHPWCGVGLPLLVARQHHRADGQPRRIQPRAAPEVRDACLAVGSGRIHSARDGTVPFSFGIDRSSRRGRAAAARTARPAGAVPVDAARGHGAALLVRRGAVLRLPAVALVRPGRVVRERVPRLLRPRHRAVDALFHETFLERQTETGRRLNFGTIGAAILWSPFYALADAGVVIARATAASSCATAISRPYSRRSPTARALRIPRRAAVGRGCADG